MEKKCKHTNEEKLKSKMNYDELRDKIDKNIICRLCLNIESDYISIDSDLSGTNSRHLIAKFNLLNVGKIVKFL